LPDSNAPREEVLRLFEQRFGVSRESLADLTFIERREEIWACSSVLPAGIEPERPSGLRALRRRTDGLKPTSTFLIALGDRITASRVDLDANGLRRVLLGQRIPSDRIDGYVALCFRGDVIGCGRIRGGSLRALIPTGRRQELLGALAADPRG
jgi:NOL1/NOP2/fmu family ribosome biogenesis protein